MLIPKSSRVCTPSFKSVAPKVYLTYVPFVAIFWPNMNKTGCGHIHVLNSPDNINSKYICGHGSNSIGSSVSAQIHYLGILNLTQGKEVWPGGTQPMLLPG